MVCAYSSAELILFAEIGFLNRRERSQLSRRRLFSEMFHFKEIVNKSTKNREIEATQEKFHVFESEWDWTSTVYVQLVK